MEIFKNGKNEFVHIGRGIMVPSLVHTYDHFEYNYFSFN